MASSAGTGNGDNILEAHGEKIDPDTALALTLAGMVLANILCCWGCIWAVVINRTRDSDTSLAWAVLHGLPGFLLVLSTGFFYEYSMDLKERDEIDYHGLVRVVNVTFQERLVSNKDRECSQHGGALRCERDVEVDETMWYEAVYQVDWGYQWGCPNSVNNKACSATFTKCRSPIWGTACEELIFLRECGEEQAKAWVMDCVQRDGYNLATNFSNYTTYDPTVGPSQDENWFSVKAYGVCDTCEVQINPPSSPKEIRLSRNGGFVLLGLSVCLFLMLVGYHQSKKCKQRRLEQAQQLEAQTQNNLHVSKARSSKLKMEAFDDEGA